MIGRTAIRVAGLAALLAAATAAGQAGPPAAPGPPLFAAPDGVDEYDPFEAEPIRLAQNSEFAGRVADPQEVAAPPRPGGPGRRGIFQGLDLTTDWTPRFEDFDGLGRTSLSAAVKLGVPPHLFGTPVLVAPRAGLHLFDGPDGIDVPARAYDLELGFSTFRQLSPKWLAIANVNVGVYGDDDSLGDSDALRPNGSVIAIYTAAPGWQWVFGVAYLNRDDIAVVPAVGLIVDRGDVKYELSLPRPRIVWRRDAPPGSERSVYLAGELGGGAWAVRRDSGATDTLNLSRFGAVLGWEQADVGGWSRRYEIGYLFGQQIEYANTGEEFDLDDSLIARLGVSY